MDHRPPLFHLLDATWILGGILAAANYLTPVFGCLTALAGLCWYLLQFSQAKAVQEWFAKFRSKNTPPGPPSS